MATIRQKIEERADDLLDSVFRLKKLKEHMAEECPELLDLEIEGWVTVSTYSRGGHISVSPEAQQDRALAIQLLDLSGKEKVVKSETFSGGRRAAFTFGGNVSVAVDRPNTAPCKEYKVRDKQVRTLSVCGEVDTDRYEILEEVVEVPEAA